MKFFFVYIKVARIATPTHTSLRHSRVHDGTTKCPRCQQEEEDEENRKNNQIPIYKKWWSETTRHIMALKSNLNKDAENNLKGEGSIDEIAANNPGTSIFPKLKLSREVPKKRVQLQLPVTVVKMV